MLLGAFAWLQWLVSGHEWPLFAVPVLYSWQLSRMAGVANSDGVAILRPAYPTNHYECLPEHSKPARKDVAEPVSGRRRDAFTTLVAAMILIPLSQADVTYPYVLFVVLPRLLTAIGLCCKSGSSEWSIGFETGLCLIFPQCSFPSGFSSVGGLLMDNG